MGPGLLAPLGLAALATLVVPILLHLVRRLELTRTEFAALRWIGAHTRPERRLRLERPWLLLSRLALLSALALLLARPVWESAPAAPAGDWILVVPGVTRAAARAAAEGIHGEWHWLAPDFPPLEDAPPATVPLASLLREADARLPTGRDLHVIAPEEVAGLDGERPRLSRRIDWRVAPGRMAEAADAQTPALPLVVRHAPDAAAALPYLRAVVAAWNVDRPGCCSLDIAPLDEPVPPDARRLVWLGPQRRALDAWIEQGGVALASGMGEVPGEPLWRDAADHVLARSASRGQGRLIALRGTLAPADLPVLLDADFPQRLRAAFEGAPLPPTRAGAAQARPAMAEADLPMHSADRARVRPLDSWLALLAALLFVVERLLATWRRRGAA